MKIVGIASHGMNLFLRYCTFVKVLIHSFQVEALLLLIFCGSSRAADQLEVQGGGGHMCKIVFCTSSFPWKTLLVIVTQAMCFGVLCYQLCSLLVCLDICMINWYPELKSLHFSGIAGIRYKPKT